jgi:WD40 repeat protein
MDEDEEASLYLPIVLWTGAPSRDSHMISCLCGNRDGSRLASGASNGNVVLWSCGEHGALNPLIYIEGHECGVLDIVDVVFDERDAFLSGKFFWTIIDFAFAFAVSLF